MKGWYFHADAKIGEVFDFPWPLGAGRTSQPCEVWEATIIATDERLERSAGKSRDTWAGNRPLTSSKPQPPAEPPKKPFPKAAMKRGWTPTI